MVSTSWRRRILAVLRHPQYVCRQFGFTLEAHHASCLDIVDSFLNERPQLLELAFFAAEQAQASGNGFIGIPINAGFNLLFDETSIFRSQLDLGHFDLLLFSNSTD
ncbi:hypothetical protein IP76_19130 [Rhizobium sp. AAP43]|nr:hypothetical protein IP76_19130 [Rhizobium sp. AAP43]